MNGPIRLEIGASGTFNALANSIAPRRSSGERSGSA
jgi:hypothetical protein